MATRSQVVVNEYKAFAQLLTMQVWAPSNAAFETFEQNSNFTLDSWSLQAFSQYHSGRRSFVSDLQDTAVSTWSVAGHYNIHEGY